MMTSSVDNHLSICVQIKSTRDNYLVSDKFHLQTLPMLLTSL